MARRNREDDAVVAAGGVALVASILGNIKQAGDNANLQRSMEALQRLVQDWQQAYHNIEAQLTLALRTNEEQTRLLAQQRHEIGQLRARAYAAEQRALEAEAALAVQAQGGASGTEEFST
jgi:predicted  nucleic acid-binding Zn-ribbon protein